jgi:AcrR family transcriptional regulator
MTPTDDAAPSSTPTRRRLLDAGFRMWVDEPPETLFGGFTVSRVAKAAGVTRATFYAYWPSTEQYLHDLLAHLGDHIPPSYDRAVASAAGQMGAAGNDVVSQLLASCDREFGIILEDPALRVRLAFLSQMDDPGIAEELTRRLRAVEAMKVERYGVVIEGWGREARPPISGESMQAVFQMLGDAMVARHVIDPEGMPRETYGLVVTAMLMMFTRRIDDTRDLPSLIEQINAWPAMGIRLRGQVRADRSQSAPVLDPATARAVVVAARRLLATMGWQELALNEIASVMATTEEALLRAFGSKSGLAMAICDLNVGERISDMTSSGDPITDLRQMIAILTEELRRSPALTQSVVLLLSGVAAMPMTEIIADRTQLPVFVRQVIAAQAAGQLRADLDPMAFATSLVRVLLTENAWPGPGSGSEIDVPEILLAGAGAPLPSAGAR